MAETVPRIPELKPTDKLDVVIVPHGHSREGIWVSPGQLPLNEGRTRTVMEIVTGALRVRIRERNPDGHDVKLPPLKFATEQEWAFVIGLVVVEQAIRMQL